MRALVTGGAGFIGSHLCDALLARGDEVRAVDDLSTGARANVAHLAAHPRFRLVEGDCGEPAILGEAAAGCDAIFHLAAAVGVELVVARPVETIERNVDLTEEVLKAAARGRTPVVFTSTSEVYGKGIRAPFVEDDDIVLGPSTKARWGYACSKLLDEFLAFAYMKERGVPVTVLRLFNTVGPRQTGRHGMVLPRFIGQALAGGPLTIFGDGEQTRAFCDVADVVRALLAAAGEPRSRGEVINVGSRDEITIRRLAEKVRDLLNPRAALNVIPYDQAYAPGFEDMRRRVPDIAKAERLLGWTPRIALDETIARVARGTTSA